MASLKHTACPSYVGWCLAQRCCRITTDVSDIHPDFQTKKKVEFLIHTIGENVQNSFRIVISQCISFIYSDATQRSAIQNAKQQENHALLLMFFCFFSFLRRLFYFKNACAYIYSYCYCCFPSPSVPIKLNRFVFVSHNIPDVIVKACDICIHNEKSLYDEAFPFSFVILNNCHAIYSRRHKTLNKSKRYIEMTEKSIYILLCKC